MKLGSSPLARGLRDSRATGSQKNGIIPARAGFTKLSSWPRTNGKDHPRSRGVYLRGFPARIVARGSSPLARGLLEDRKRVRPDLRIIPARAGFTGGLPIILAGRPDHPRSRGVYPAAAQPSQKRSGSSPLARGLLNLRPVDNILTRIIPARAGFTRASTRMREKKSGSSPLARGLRASRSGPDRQHGIIPARAGFTICASVSRISPRDHPRSRGVYACGSLESQRTRTLPDPGCLHCRPRARSAELR